MDQFELNVKTAGAGLTIRPGEHTLGTALDDNTTAYPVMNTLRPTTLIHSCEHGETFSRTVHLSGGTILDRLKDRHVSVPVEFDGTEGFARVHNKYTDLIERTKTYRVRVIFDTQAYRHGADDAFIYTVVGSVN